MIVGGVTLVAVIAIGGWLSRSLTGPLRDLTAGARRFAAGDGSVRVAARSRDEIGQLCLAFNGMVDDISSKNMLIEAKNRENEALLLNVLPGPIANRLRGGEQDIANGFANVTVLFADLVGFTALTSEMPPQEVVTLLNGLFSRFDTAAAQSSGSRRSRRSATPIWRCAACRRSSTTTPSAWCAWRSAWCASRGAALDVACQSGADQRQQRSGVAGVISKSRYTSTTCGGQRREHWRAA